LRFCQASSKARNKDGQYQRRKGFHCRHSDQDGLPIAKS
jgi:hypothetical protein